MAWLVRIALLRFLGRRVLWFLMVYDILKLVLAARRALIDRAQGTSARSSGDRDRVLESPP